MRGTAAEAGTGIYPAAGHARARVQELGVGEHRPEIRR
jgi:hypothetical protein